MDMSIADLKIMMGLEEYNKLKHENIKITGQTRETKN